MFRSNIARWAALAMVAGLGGCAPEVNQLIGKWSTDPADALSCPGPDLEFTKDTMTAPGDGSWVYEVSYESAGIDDWHIYVTPAVTPTYEFRLVGSNEAEIVYGQDVGCTYHRVSPQSPT